MEDAKNQVLFSKPGKLTVHLFPILNPDLGFPQEEKLPELPSQVNVKELVLRAQAELQPNVSSSSPSTKPTASFKCQSKAAYEHAFRNRSGSPRVGRYSPKHQVISPHSQQVQFFSKKKASPKPKVILLPKCLDQEFTCVYPHTPKNPLAVDPTIKRAVTSQSHYDKQVNKQLTPIPEQSSKTIKGVRDFSKMLNRKPLAKEGDVPHPKRFTFMQPVSYVLSSNKRPQAMKFDQQGTRHNSITPRAVRPFYNQDDRVVKPRVGASEFKYMQGHKTQVLEERLYTPRSPELEKYDRAYNKQSNVKSPRKVVPMDKLSGRDDSMYRTNEQYKMNVPERQSATSRLKFLSNSDMLSLLSAAKLKGTLSTYSARTNDV